MPRLPLVCRGRRPRAAVLLAVLATLPSAGVPGCARPAAPWSSDRPAARLAEARAAVSEDDLPAAYRALKEIRERHPESAEADEAYPLAAGVFKALWRRTRYREPDSVWHTTEPEFMYAWLADFYRGGTFPREPVETLLLGLPWSFSQRFLAWAETRPETARWEHDVVEDNGIVEAVTAEPASSATAAGTR